MGKPAQQQDLRIPGIVRGKKIQIQVDGVPVKAFEGETVHAALTAAGIKRLKTQANRGVFCGMGICYECLVTIDRIPDQRACMTLVRENMEISTRDA